MKNCFQNTQFTVCMHIYGEACLCIGLIFYESYNRIIVNFSRQPALPMFSENKSWVFTCLLFASHLPLPSICMCKADNFTTLHSSSNFFLTHKQCSCEKLIYVGVIYRNTDQIIAFFPLFVMKFLAFSFNYMYLCSFELKGKTSSKLKCIYMCLNSCFK